MKIILLEEETSLLLVGEEEPVQKIEWSVAGGNVWLITVFEVAEGSPLIPLFITRIEQYRKQIIPLCAPSRDYFQGKKWNKYLKALDETYCASFMK